MTNRCPTLHLWGFQRFLPSNPKLKQTKLPRQKTKTPLFWRDVKPFKQTLCSAVENRRGKSCPSSFRTRWRRPFVHPSWDYVFLARRRTGSGFGPSGSGWVRAGGCRGSSFSACGAAGVRVVSEPQVSQDQGSARPFTWFVRGADGVANADWGEGTWSW